MDLNLLETKLEKFKKELSKFNKKRRLNFFDITLISEREVSHSAFLAWLLNPKENHGLNDLFLQYILHKIKFNEKYAIKDIVVETEITGIRRRIDIIIYINDKIICIENKIWDYPTVNQIEDEIKEFKPNYMVLLAPNQIITSFQKENNIKNINYVGYDYIHKSINELMNKTENNAVKILLENYNQNLEESIMTKKYNLFSYKSILYKKYEQFIVEVEDKYKKEKEIIKNLIIKKIQSQYPTLNKFGFTSIGKIFILNENWEGNEFDIYLAIDIDNLHKNKTSISIQMDSYTKEKGQNIRKEIITKFGNFLEQNNYTKSKDNYIMYEKEFKFGNFVEDLFKEIKILMQNNMDELILNCIEKHNK